MCYAEPFNYVALESVKDHSESDQWEIMNLIDWENRFINHCLNSR